MLLAHNFLMSSTTGIELVVQDLINWFLFGKRASRHGRESKDIILEQHGARTVKVS